MTTYLAPTGIPYSGDPIYREDGSIDPEIPDRPSIRHQWENGQWILKPWYAWSELKDALRGTEIFSRAIGTNNQNAFALLMDTFDSKSDDEAKMADFQWAIAAVRAGLAEDYTSAQLQVFRELLEQCGFPIFL